MKGSEKDIWSQWLLHRRFGGDSQRMQAVLDYLYPVRDKVLNHANLGDGDILLDVGCGDGLIAFGALEKIKTGKVIFSDISQDLLDYLKSNPKPKVLVGSGKRCSKPRVIRKFQPWQKRWIRL